MTDVTTPLDKAVGKMLMALGGKPEPERIISFTEALDDAHLCPQCGAKAARKISSTLRRRPFPGDLVDVTREIQGSAEHQAHLSDRAALGGNDLHIWWTTQGPVHVRAAWPELTGESAVRVAALLEGLGFVEPDAESIATELGTVDEYGPTWERRWWLEMHPELFPPLPVPSMPKGDE